MPSNNKPNRVNIKAVFLFKYPCRKGLDRVTRFYPHFLLQYNRACIEVLIHIMYRAAGCFHTGLKRLFLCVKTSKGGQQARMYIDDSFRESLNERRRKQ